MNHMLCLGDSITDCGRLWEHAPLGGGYVSLLDAALNAKERTWKITNRGVDGFTVGRVLESVKRDGIPADTNIITILIGINDICLMMETAFTDAQRREMQRAFLQKYEELISLISGDAHSIILMEPFIFSRPQEYISWLPYVMQMSEGISALSQKYNIPYIRLLNRLQRAAEAQGFRAVTVDGVHLTHAGHRILADALLSSPPLTSCLHSS